LRDRWIYDTDEFTGLSAVAPVLEKAARAQAPSPSP
jgi:hypothetical protein